MPRRAAFTLSMAARANSPARFPLNHFNKSFLTFEGESILATPANKPALCELTPLFFPLHAALRLPIHRSPLLAQAGIRS